MEDQNAILPITAAVAITLFVLREALESLKKHRTNLRRASAIKRIVARECELNNWSMRSLRRQLRSIHGGLQQEPFSEFALAAANEAEPELREIDLGGEGGSRIFQTYRKVVEGYLLDAAILSKTFYDLMEGGYDAIVAVDHVRSSLIEHLSNGVDRELLISCCDWGIEEIDDAEQAIKRLYQACTGNELTTWRVR